MGKKIQYPEKTKMLVVRDCVKGICNLYDPASITLSVFLYWYEHSKTELEDGKFKIRRSQNDLASDALGMITPRTITDKAIPALILFGYVIDIEDGYGSTTYTIDIKRVQEAIFLWAKNGLDSIRNFIISGLKWLLQSEKFQFQISKEETEKFLFISEIFQFQLEKIQFINRNFSVCKRGPKRKSQAPGGAKITTTEIKRDYREITRENSNTPDTPPQTDLLPPEPPTAHAATTTLQKNKNENNSQKNTSSRSRSRTTPPPAPSIDFTPEERAVYDLWCKMPHFHAKGGVIVPPITQTVKDRCKQLAGAKLDTYEEMLACFNLAKKQAISGGVQLGNIVNVLPTVRANVLDTRPPEPEHKEIPDDKPVWWCEKEHDGGRVEHWYLYRLMPVSEARHYGWNANALPGIDANRIRALWQKYSRGEIKIPTGALVL